MKKQFFLTLGLVLIVNSILFAAFYYYNQYNFVNIDKGDNVVLNKKTQVIEQNITQKYDITNVQSKIISTIKQVSPSVVSIVISKDLAVYYYADPFAMKPYIEKQKKKIGGGSGIIISNDGYILTNKHVVSDLDADYSVVTKEGNIYKVDKIWSDPILDIAVIHVVDEKGKKVYNLKPAKIIDYKSKIEIGQFVLAIGNALAEYNDSVTLGILSAKGRELEENNGSLYIGLYQTDAAINPGNSGGPLINIVGEVIGVNTAITAMGQGIGFSIPINREFVNATLKSIKKYGSIKRPLLGIKILQLNKTIAKQYKLPTYEGVLIQEVLPNSPAMKAGLKKGDIIIKVDGVDVTKDNPIIYDIFTHNLGDEVEIMYLRNGKNYKKNIKLTEF